MARSKKETKNNNLLLPLIFLMWFLVKIGEWEFKLVKLVFRLLVILGTITVYPFFKIGRVFLGLIEFLSFGKIHILKNKKRGRPRTQPFWQFYGKKVLHVLDMLFPKPLRIGVGVAVVSALIFGYSYFLIQLAHDLPNPKRLSEPDFPLTNEIYDRSGKLLYKSFEDKNRSLVTLSDLPEYVPDATLAIEDKNFYSHLGVDLIGITRAFLSNLRHESIQGGSTITQQLVKNILLTPERTLSRKIQEVMLSFWVERIYTKDEILTMYLNEISYGGPTLGINAASQTYFGKDAKELTLSEAAFLAGLPASPTTYSPYGENIGFAKDRQKEVLRRMVEDGYISEDDANKAYAEELHIKPSIASISAPHFVMFVRDYLSQKYGPRFLNQGGLKIETSLDLDLQQKSQTIVTEEVAKLSDLAVSNGAAMIVDPRTGQILAMIGSKDYYEPKFGNYNVTLALRQPGSSIKPITYATAFKLGLSPGTIMLDTPTSFNDGVNIYAPVNYDGNFHGAVTIRTALGSSYNIPAVKTLALVGLPNMLQTSRDLGLTTLNDTGRYGLSLTLGAGEVKLIDMMTVYSTFSQNGVKHLPNPILKITDHQGNIVEDNTQGTEGYPVINPGVAYLITNILSDNNARTPAFGANSLLNIPGHTVAVKTGTTDNKKDNWTFGYTRALAVGVWVGNNDNTPMNPRLTSGITGAAPIWNKLMTLLLKDKPDLAFERPENIKESIVDGKKDLVMTDLEQKTVTKAVAQVEVSPIPSPIDANPTGSKSNVITYTDPFSTFTFDPTKPGTKP